ncbi:MAG: Holliday junction branch migration protein RuvA [Treponema sp.]|nr:Holliday junction branch migration protein RuvA [Treponema sp.]
MFNSLTGIITGKFPQKLFLDVNGVEWDLIVPDTTLDDLPKLGEKARVFTWLQHTDSAMALYGFASSKDRDLFFDLNKVDGVGPKSAVKIMSSIQRDQLIASLENGDLAALEKIPGLGKKTAQKMLLALKGKLTLDEDLPGTKVLVNRGGEYADVVAALEKNPGLGKKTAQKMLLALKGKLTLDEDLPGTKVLVNRGGEYADVVAALSNMGYDKRDVEACISKLVEELNAQTPQNGEVAFKNKTRDAKEEILFRQAIVALAQ